MNMIESSLYASQRTMSELQTLASVGVTTIVEPITYMGSPRRYAQTYLDDYERLITGEARRCAEVGIEHLTLVGVPAGDAPYALAAHQAIDHLAKYLTRPGVVGIGEVGFESFTEEESSILRRQMRLARLSGMPIVIQAPIARKAHAVGLSLQMAESEGLDPQRVLVKGIDAETMPLVRHFGAWAGLTLHPSFLSTDRAIALLGRYGTEGIVLQSDAGRGYGQPYAIPEFLKRLADEGLSQPEQAKLGYHNPKWFFSQGIGSSQVRARELATASR
jgi:predicted metal-dependent TIM-barrel fold hydrolase